MIPPQRREISENLRSVLTLVFTISLGLWNFPCATRAQETLPLHSPELLSDSLQLTAVELEIEQAEIEVTRTNLLHRLIPRLHLSGSLGIKDIFFVDPSNTLLSSLPKEAYRLTLTLSLSDILDDSGHRIAELRRDRMRAELTRLRMKLKSDRGELQRALALLELAASLDSTELSMKEEVLRFTELRFTHGNVEFDDLTRSRLDVLNARKSLLQLEARRSDLRLRLGVQQ